MDAFNVITVPEAAISKVPVCDLCKTLADEDVNEPLPAASLICSKCKYGICYLCAIKSEKVEVDCKFRLGCFQCCATLPGKIFCVYLNI
jgi:hypothetical protein